MNGAKRVAVIGGGLAGIAAATALAENGFEVALYERRRRLGGRASSFEDAATGELLDFCQHVSMGCCTNFADLCRRLGIETRFCRLTELTFIGPDRRQYELRASRFLPAPLHLLPSLWRLRYLSRRERRQTVWQLWRLARWGRKEDRRTARGASDAKRTLPETSLDEETMGQWLQRRGASPNCVRRFWEVVLVSALGERVETVSVAAARKVFVDGFLASRHAYEVFVPDAPLGQLYGEHVLRALEKLGVQLHLGRAVRLVVAEGDVNHITNQEHAEESKGPTEPVQRQESASSRRVSHIVLDDGSRVACDFAVLATTWRQVWRLLSPSLRADLPELEAASVWPSAPITGVHLWFHRPVCGLDHAVLVDRLGQWLFYRGRGPAPRTDCAAAHYYQVVISASHRLVSFPARLLVEFVCEELRSIWPEARRARLLASQVVTERHAVVSPTPEFDRHRPGQRTAVENLMLAGDWTATGWPSTMESAVRSGRLAAEAILHKQGRGESLVLGDLTR